MKKVYIIAFLSSAGGNTLLRGRQAIVTGGHNQNHFQQKQVYKYQAQG